MSSRARAIDNFLTRLDAEEEQARASYVEQMQRYAESLCRRIRQALVDLDLDDLVDWAEPVDGVLRFGGLEPSSVERFVEMLERVAERARRAS